ncbi:MAG TPA: hypothetical protein VM536_01645 [Chloroflexia bacterium]|nr:hypothetical protein [Chloroflexia bacterium]
MVDHPAVPGPPARTRPEFVMPAALGGAAEPLVAGGAGLQFFGSQVFSGPVIAGDLNVTIQANPRDEEIYLSQVASTYSVWRTEYILGTGSAQASPFIPTDTAALMQGLAAGAGPTAARASRRPVALQHAVTQYRRVVLLGKPGAGKSSYLQYLTLLFAPPAPVIPGVLPVLVELSAYSDSGPFLPFLQSFLRNPPEQDPLEPRYVTSPWLADALESYLTQGRVLLLLDGWNEIPGGPGAATRLQEIQAFLAHYPQVRAVITCRMIDYESELAAAGFRDVVIDPWTADQMARYLQERGDTLLLTRLHARDPLLLSLGQVPALLEMISQMAANYIPGDGDPAATPPFLTSQSGLFKAFVGFLLEWAGRKDRDNALLFPRPIVIAALARLAAAMESAGLHGSAVPQAWATDHIAASAADLFGGMPAPGGLAGDARRRLLDFGCEATILDTPATRDTVRFWHLAHQEYFAALALQNTGGPATAGAFTPATDQVTSMAAALAPQPAVAISAILARDDPRAALVAAKALLSAGGA